MRSKFFVILVCCLLALAVLVLSQNGEQVIKANQIKSLLITPITKTTPETTLRPILEFSTIEELQLLLQQEEEEEQVSYINTSGVAGANADPITGCVWAVALGDGLKPSDSARVGFKSITLCPTGSFSQTGVTVTVTANILEIQHAVTFKVYVYKDGRSTSGNYKRIRDEGRVSVTSGSFTMEPNHKYYAVSYFFCGSLLNQASILIAEITDIDWNF